MTVLEQTIIDKLAGHFEAIDGIKNAFPFAKNPDTISPAQLPAVVFFPENFESDHSGHQGLFTNLIRIKAILFVAPMQSRGGKLKFLENAAMPFLGKVRTKFQTTNIVDDFLSLGLLRAFLVRGKYGAGGNLLRYNGITYIGAHFDFEYTEKTTC